MWERGDRTAKRRLLRTSTCPQYLHKVLSNNLHVLPKGPPPFLEVMDSKAIHSKRSANRKVLVSEWTVRHRQDSEAEATQQVKRHKLIAQIMSNIFKSQATSELSSNCFTHFSIFFLSMKRIQSACRDQWIKGFQNSELCRLRTP